MALRKDLQSIIEESELSFEEMRAFTTGLMMLTEEEQYEFYKILRNDPGLIYPLYINFKAKLRAAHGSEREWKEAVENEIVELEDYLTKKRVGGEIK